MDGLACRQGRHTGSKTNLMVLMSPREDETSDTKRSGMDGLACPLGRHTGVEN
ncbi:hypothetical protein Hanom_Chr06g00525131 [Helianthus anomalus]